MATGVCCPCSPLPERPPDPPTSTTGWAARLPAPVQARPPPTPPHSLAVFSDVQHRPAHPAAGAGQKKTDHLVAQQRVASGGRAGLDAPWCRCSACHMRLDAAPSDARPSNARPGRPAATPHATVALLAMPCHAKYCPTPSPQVHCPCNLGASSVWWDVGAPIREALAWRSPPPPGPLATWQVAAPPCCNPALDTRRWARAGAVLGTASLWHPSAPCPAMPLPPHTHARNPARVTSWSGADVAAGSGRLPRGAGPTGLGAGAGNAVLQSCPPARCAHRCTCATQLHACQPLPTHCAVECARSPPHPADTPHSCLLSLRLMMGSASLSAASAACPFRCPQPGLSCVPRCSPRY